MATVATAPGWFVLMALVLLFVGSAVVALMREADRRDEWRRSQEEEAQLEAYCAFYCGPPFTAEGEHDSGGRMTTFQAGDKVRARGDDEVRNYRESSRIRGEALVGGGWIQRVFGEDGLGLWDHPKRNLRLIHSIAREKDGEIWAHVSLSRRDRKLPTWEQVSYVAQLLYPDRVALQVLPPAAEWYSESEVHHLWVCLTRRLTPDFRGPEGAI